MDKVRHHPDKCSTAPKGYIDYSTNPFRIVELHEEEKQQQPQPAAAVAEPVVAIRSVPAVIVRVDRQQPREVIDVESLQQQQPPQPRPRPQGIAINRDVRGIAHRLLGPSSGPDSDSDNNDNDVANISELLLQLQIELIKKPCKEVNEAEFKDNNDALVKNQCTICMTNYRTHIAIPCGHFTHCLECIVRNIEVTRSMNCATCRAKVKSFNRVYN
jgi:hypothetical protein